MIVLHRTQHWNTVRDWVKSLLPKKQSQAAWLLMGLIMSRWWTKLYRLPKPQPPRVPSASKEAIELQLKTCLFKKLCNRNDFFHAWFATDNQKEGMSAFLEKSLANFKETRTS
jgi:hypothetical protein